MLSRVDVVNHVGSVLSLPLDDISGGYSVEEIDGLDPVKAVLVSSSFANQDGEQYHTSRREKRNITMKLGFEPDYVNTSVESLRKKLYNFFMPKSPATMKFYMVDGTEYDISGRVESCEAPLFVQDPVAAISLLCFDPDFIDPTSKRFSGTATAVAAISMGSDTLIQYDGTVDTGFLATITAVRACTSLSIDVVGPDGVTNSLVLSGLSLVANDVVKISTVPGNKYVTKTSGGTTTSILSKKRVTDPWLMLDNGANHLRVYSADGGAMPFTIDYTVRYGGL